MADVRELARLARDAEALKPGGPDALDALDHLRAAVFPRRHEADPLTALRGVLPQAADAAREDDALAILRAAMPGPDFVALRDVRGDLAPPLLRLAGSNSAILTAGEVVVLSGAGGRGKSTLALQWALAAAVPMGEVSPPFVESAGFEIRRGPVVVASYEDDPPVVRQRAARLCGAIPEALTLVAMRGWPLYGPPPDTPFYNARPEPLPAWAPFWCQVAARIEAGRKIVGTKSGPGIVVLDPAADAFAGEDSRVTAVRAFLHAVRREAARIGVGVLIVTHPSKAGLGRNGSGSHAVGGSPAWHDASRGVLYMDRMDSDSGTYRLKVEKANYGPWGETVHLQRESGGGTFGKTDPVRERDGQVRPA